VYIPHFSNHNKFLIEIIDKPHRRRSETSDIKLHITKAQRKYVDKKYVRKHNEIKWHAVYYIYCNYMSDHIKRMYACISNNWKQYIMLSAVHVIISAEMLAVFMLVPLDKSKRLSSVLEGFIRTFDYLYYFFCFLSKYWLYIFLFRISNTPFTSVWKITPLSNLVWMKVFRMRKSYNIEDDY
jgi:hypothetical protein